MTHIPGLFAGELEWLEGCAERGIIPDDRSTRERGAVYIAHALAALDTAWGLIDELTKAAS